MKCQQCGGKLEGLMNVCSYCGVRQQVDLQHVHYRNFVSEKPMACVGCQTPLSGVEIDLGGEVLQIEYCEGCHGMFFNPGELERLLEFQTVDLVWMDQAQIAGLGAVVGEANREHERIKYRKCPYCQERMHPHNFGGGSGVILDRCGTHGYWLDSGEVRALAEWWRAGGKLIYQEHASQTAKWLRPEAKREEVKSAWPEHHGPLEEYRPQQAGPFSVWDAVLAAVIACVLD